MDEIDNLIARSEEAMDAIKDNQEYSDNEHGAELLEQLEDVIHLAKMLKSDFI